MRCRNCGKEVSEDVKICGECGFDPMAESNYCQECGASTKPNQKICVACGCELLNRATSLNVVEYAGFFQRVAAALIDFVVLE
ncbi:zinc-ribbon domain-containing protein [Alkaliphilus crotonatoxidans]